MKGGRELLSLLALLGLLVIGAPRALAFSINSGFTNGCHELITLEAFNEALVGLPGSALLTPPSEELWREVAEALRRQLDFPDALDADSLSEVELYFMVSLLVGVRAPDTDGHSVLNLGGLRELHSDPSPEGQYAHALRGIEDDFEAGNLAAVAGTKAIIREQIEEANRLLRLPFEKQTVIGSFYLDYYGHIELKVHGPSYHLGLAAHALQDSFSHAIRDEARGYREIVHVMNYVEAVAGDLDEARDGLAHSDSMDDCTAEPGEEGGTAEAATRATVDLLLATRSIWDLTDHRALDHFFERWMVLKTMCHIDDGFCGNERWVEVTRIAQTKPYLESIFGCAAGAGGEAPTAAILLVMLLAASRLGRRRTRTW